MKATSQFSIFLCLFIFSRISCLKLKLISFFFPRYLTVSLRSPVLNLDGLDGPSKGSFNIFNFKIYNIQHYTLINLHTYKNALKNSCGFKNWISCGSKKNQRTPSRVDFFKISQIVEFEKNTRIS